MQVGGIASGIRLSQSPTLSGGDRSVSTTLVEGLTIEGQTSAIVDNSSRGQLGIDNHSFDFRLQTWVERADASEKAKRTTAQARILGARDNNMEILDLSGLNLTSVPSSLDELPQLKLLNLSNNKLINIPKGFFDKLTELEVLDLGYNQLNTLPYECFDGLNALVTLNLSGNQISTLPKCITALTSLVSLYLAKNELTILQNECFDGLNALEDLDLSSNQLKTLPDKGFTMLPALEALHLSDNQISTLPKCFTELTSLIWLCLDQNYLNERDALTIGSRQFAIYNQKN
jgi:Leucine-rich repeat (LRR) protein